MNVVACTQCGSTKLVDEGGFVVCFYCNTKFIPAADEAPARDTTIGLGSDIEQLLEKCRQDPDNRRRYASLILDMDPTNSEALQFLR